MDDKNYRRIFHDVINGYSSYFVAEKKRYIKHQSVADVVDFEMVYDMHFDRAKERGLPTKEEIFEQLEEDGLWSQADDAEIEKQTFYVESLIKNKKNIYLKSALNQINKQIQDAELELSKLKVQKEELTSNCCETYALNRANDYYMFTSFYTDEDLKERLYSQEEFEYIEASKIKDLIKIYNSFHGKFSDKNLQNLVIQDFYKIYYAFSESCVDFFGKPIVELTNFQLNLIIYTRIFKNIFEQHPDIPESLMKDAPGLLDYANSSEVREEIKKKIEESDGGGSSIVGATQEDLKELGIETSQSNSLHKAAQAKGGSLSMKDLMDLSGV